MHHKNGQECKGRKLIHIIMSFIYELWQPYKTQPLLKLTAPSQNNPGHQLFCPPVVLLSHCIGHKISAWPTCYYSYHVAYMFVGAVTILQPAQNFANRKHLMNSTFSISKF